MPDSDGNFGDLSTHGDPGESEIKYRNLAEQAFVGVYIVQNGTFAYANPRMAEIFGYSLDEFVGKLGPVHVLSPKDYPHIHEKSKKRLIGEIEKDYYQFQCVKKDKAIIVVEV
jgi:PAS domain S-box-containing protein